MFLKNQSFSLAKIVAPTLALSLLVGCGLFKKHGDEDPEAAGDSSKTENALKNAKKDFHLMGTWESECKGSDFLGAHRREVYTFKGDVFTHVYRYYLNDHGNCDGETTFTVLQEGNFQIKDKNEGLDGNNIDFQYKESHLTPHGDNAVSALNHSGACGISDWKKDDKRQVTGQGGSATCMIPKTPIDRVDVYKNVDGKLYFGEGPLTSTFPTERPSHLDNHKGFDKK